MLGPRSLDHAIDLSIKVEEKLQNGPYYKSESKRESHSNSSFSGTSNFSSFKTQSGTFSPSVTSSSMYSYNRSTPSTTTTKGYDSFAIEKPVQMRRLSNMELQSKRAKGECFRCDEKWLIGHKCKKRELSVILIQGDVIRNEEHDCVEGNRVIEDESAQEGRQPKISLNSLVGITSPKSM